ncbi:MAG: GNAT family N-acetyltransferase [Phycisphaeraceae bacterium]|nr:GNAT family N-acetyltransferase [Phycisphaerales bacterium]QOJ17768.1 MAG: GNAT family N-acetyltransferase [Phycisphaeraceae bacterium]
MTTLHPSIAGLATAEAGFPVRVTPSWRPEAAARLVSAGERPDPVAGERFLAYASDNRITLDHWWMVTDRRGEILGCAIAVPNPGRTAMVFASRGVRDGRAEATVRAVDRACQDACEAGARLAQALIEPRERAERRVLEQAGFSTLAMLSYMERRHERHDAKSHPEPALGGSISLEPFSRAARMDFVEALGASYEGTLDCPGLSGLRDPSDVLTGHQATGCFEPSLWTLLRVDGRPSGVLLLNPTPRQGSIELVYLGLAPWARGRGLGSALLRHGLRQTASRSERTLSLAVDERNEPARRLYARHGFTCVLRRQALIRAMETS